jgi:hypothetical protein
MTAPRSFFVIVPIPTWERVNLNRSSAMSARFFGDTAEAEESRIFLSSPPPYAWSPSG